MRHFVVGQRQGYDCWRFRRHQRRGFLRVRNMEGRNAKTEFAMGREPTKMSRTPSPLLPHAQGVSQLLVTLFLTTLSQCCQPTDYGGTRHRCAHRHEPQNRLGAWFPYWCPVHVNFHVIFFADPSIFLRVQELWRKRRMGSQSKCEVSK